MSNKVNDNLLELAQFHIDYWEGTLWADVLRRDIESQDLEALNQHIKESAQQMYDREYSPNE